MISDNVPSVVILSREELLQCTDLETLAKIPIDVDVCEGHGKILYGVP